MKSTKYSTFNGNEILGRSNTETEKTFMMVSLLMNYENCRVGRDFKGHRALMLDSLLSHEHQVLCLFVYVQ